MNEQDDFDAKLAACFEREHRQIPADAFVAGTMREVRLARRRREVLRIGLRLAGLAALIVASPWLIACADWLTAAVGSSVGSSAARPGLWVLGALAATAVLVKTVRGRS